MVHNIILLFFLFISLFIQGCTKRSEIIHGKICPFCLADNPSWRKNYCPDCFRVDNRGDLLENVAMINNKTKGIK